MATCVSVRLQHTATHCNTRTHIELEIENWSSSFDHCKWEHVCRYACNTLQHTATHRNTLQHTTTHCNTHELDIENWNSIAERCTWQLVCRYACNTLQHTTTHAHTLSWKLTIGAPVLITVNGSMCVGMPATHCNTLQHTATRWNTLQHDTSGEKMCTSGESWRTNTLQHPAKHRYNTLQHTATHYQW